MSEPVFEAFVRLRADVGDFEQQAQASLRRSVEKTEQLAQQSQARIQQQAAATVQSQAAPQPLARAVEEQLTRARQLANEPLQLEVLANTQPFERETALAYEKAIELARQQADATKQAAFTAAREATQAVDALFEQSSARTTELAGARAKAAARDAAEAAAQEAASILRRTEAEAEQARLRPATELQTRSQIAATRSETAALIGDQAQADALQLESVVLATQGAAEAMKLNAEQLITAAATSAGAERELLIAQAQNANIAAERLRAEALRLQQQGLGPLGTQAGGGAGGLFGPGGLFRSRSAGLAGILGQTARFGAAGLAFGAVFQSLGELQRLLRVTGDEAFSFEGRMRNAGAELLTGNIIGGIRALAAERPAQLLGDLPARIDELRHRNDFLRVSQEKLLAAYQDSPETLDRYLFGLVSLDKISLETALNLRQLTEEFAAQELAARASAQAVGEVEQAIARAGSEAAAFGERGGEFGRGPGAVQREREQFIATGGTFQAGTGGRDVGNEIRASIASRIQDDRARLAAEVENARIIQAQKRATFENVRGTEEAAAAWRDFVLATTNLSTAVAAEKAAITAGNQALAEAQREASLASAQRADNVAAQRAALQQNLALAERNVALASFNPDPNVLAAAIREQTAARNALDAFNDSQAQLSKTAAENAAASARNAREVALANDIAAAALSGNEAKIRQTTNAAIAYYRELARTAATAEERERAQSQVLALRKSLQGDGGGDPAQLELQNLQNRLASAELVGSIPLQRRAAENIVRFWEEQVASLTGIERAQARASLIAARGRLAQVEQAADNLAELRLQNAAAAARLTEGTEDDKLAADAIVKFWQKQVREATGADKERKRAQLIAARLARQALDETQQATTTVFDLLSATAARFSQFAGDIITRDQPFTRESFVAEQAQFFRPGLMPGDLLAGPTGFTASLDAFRERNERLGKIPGSGLAASVDRNTAALDRNTDALTGNSPTSRNDRRFGPTYGEVVGARAQAMGEFWKARQARQATEAGVGATRAGF